MTELPADLPPGLVLIGAALIMPLLRGVVWKAWSILAPFATLVLVLTFPDDAVVQVDFLDFTLTLAQVNLPTRAFATIFALMATAGALFALNQDRRVEVPAALVYAGAAIGVTFAGDLLTILIFWEIMAVGSTVVVWAGFTESARKAGQRYVVVHLIGGVLFMSGIILYALGGLEAGLADPLALPELALTGDLVDPVTRSPLADLSSPASILMLIGVLVNTGAPPFGSWLPDAYPEASESGTVFLSAFTTKTSVYVLMVLFAGTELLIYIGAAMAVYGIVYAILENDMRRILSYSIVNQVGFMVCAIGIGTGLSLNGATAHAFAHIIYKALLLMSAGSVLFMTKKRLCTDLGGLYRTMPVTLWCGIIGALAISAMPLTSGFTTKSMITDAAANQHVMLAWFVLIAASAGVFLHAGIKFPWFVFFQKDSGMRPADPPWNMRAAMLLFAFLCIAIGIYPAPLYEILPFAGPPGEPLYQAYSFSHVVAQLQLLLFSGLAFFLLLPILKRTLTITLDFDWLYRRLIPRIWEVALAPFVLNVLQPVHRLVIDTVPAWAASTFGSGAADRPMKGPARVVVPRVRLLGVGITVLMFTALLGVFLVINLFW